MRTLLRALVLSTVLSLFCIAAYSQQQVAKTISNSTSPDGLIGFLQFTPSDYGSQKHPLIIFLHGIGERGNGTSQINSVTANAIPKYCAAGASMRFTVNGQTSSFVVLSPQLSVAYGYWPTFYIKEMIKYAKANLQIDPNRIYIAGLSLGGGGVWRALTEVTDSYYGFAGEIAAAAPVCGTQEEIDANMCSTIVANHLPLWNFHCMDDGTVGVGASQHAEILLSRCSNVSPAPKFTYYQSGGHNGAWEMAFDTGHITRQVNVNGAVSNFTANPNLYEWMLSNTRGTTSAPTYTAPVASAGSAQTITLPTNIITLSGSGTGTNGASISSYSWSQTSGPSTGAISLPLLNTTIVTGLVAGTYVFTLTVTDNHGLSNSSSVTVTVNPAVITSALPSTEQPVGYVKMATGSYQACADASTSGRTAVYGSSVANGGILYTDAAHTQVFNGGWNWYSYAATSGGSVAMTFAVYPNGSINQLSYCSGGMPTSTSTTTTSTQGKLLGYVKTAAGSYEGCADASSSNRIAVYGKSLTNGSILYSDAALTQVYNGGWSWYSLTPTVGGLVTNAFAIFPDGSINMIVNCAGGVPVAPQTTPIGYVKTAAGSNEGCADASSSNRIALYGKGISNGAILYTDAALTQVYNGGWSWYSFTPTLGGLVTNAFAIFPDGSINMMVNCAGGVPVAPPANLLGYVKTAAGSNEGCADASSSNRIAVYGKSLTNGSILYSDAALTQVYNGGWSWYSLTPSVGGLVTNAFAIFPDGSINMIVNCAGGVPVAAPANVLGYVKTAAGSYEGCADASSSNRVAIYGKSLTNGSIVYSDAALTQVYNGGWSWYSLTPTVGGLVTNAFAIFPDGSINMIVNCAGGVPTAGPTTTQTVSPVGYVKLSVGPYAACADPSTSNRIPLYANGSASNGTIVYTDAAKTQVYNGGWNWYSFTPTLGGTVASAFAIYPDGSIALLMSCSNGSRLIDGSSASLMTTQTQATISSVDSIQAAGKLSVYPNPVHTTATIELTSDINDTKAINLYNANGILISKYNWSVTRGKNIYLLKNAASLPNGFYIVDVRNSNGVSVGKQKFIKM